MWCRYYNIDIYHRRKVTKQRMKGMKEMMNKKTERTEFNDEEQRRYVLKISLYFGSFVYDYPLCKKIESIWLRS